jgi:regulator of RNase E activity RraA
MTTQSSPDAATLSRLAELGAATIYEANGQTGVFDAGLKSLNPASRLAGRAVTVDLPPPTTGTCIWPCWNAVQATSSSATPTGSSACPPPKLRAH